MSTTSVETIADIVIPDTRARARCHRLHQGSRE